MTLPHIKALAEWCLPQHERRLKEMEMLGKRDYDERNPPCKLVQNCDGSTESDVLYGIGQLLCQLCQLATKGRFYVSEPAALVGNATVARYDNLALTFSTFFDIHKYRQDVNIICWFYPA